MTSIKNDACRICGKPLKDPVSVDLGMGPVCRVASKLKDVRGRQQDLFGNERSTYSFEVRGDVICITDLDRGRSVTNDADRVIEDLVECLGTLAGKKVIYRDTTGVWDELVVSGDAFNGFKSLGERYLNVALLKLVRRTVRVPRSTPVTLDQFLSEGASGFKEVARVETVNGDVSSVTFPDDDGGDEVEAFDRRVSAAEDYAEDHGLRVGDVLHGDHRY